MDSNKKSSYRSIFKATSLLGSVQIYQIMINIIKSKFVAVLLGAEGVGIQGLFTSTITLIQSFTSFGLSQSAVKNVAEAASSNDQNKIVTIVTALRKLIVFTGLIGTFTLIILSPFFSKSSFGDNSYIIPLILLSVILLLDQINAGQKVILQGTRQLKSLAKCSSYGVTIGLFVSIPLYYLWGTDAIVVNLILASCTSLALSWYFARKVNIRSTSMHFKDAFIVGRDMLSMGVAMSLSAILVSISAYILRAWIRYNSGVEVVGFYTAGYILMTQYTGLVFTSMSTDYYPRLAGLCGDNVKSTELINQQTEVGIILLTPLMLIFVIFVPLLVSILYTEAFMPINQFIIWCAVGMLFKMASWSIAMVFIAKGESKLYMINELLASLYMLALNVVGFYWGGLSGLGISYSVSYLFYFFQVYLLAKFKYGFKFSFSCKKMILLCQAILCIGVCFTYIFRGNYIYIIGGILTVASVLISYKELNKRMQLSSVIKSKIKIK